MLSAVSSTIDGASPARRDEMRATYKLEFRPPLGQSCARQIAAPYGISYQQVEKV